MANGPRPDIVFPPLPQPLQQKGVVAAVRCFGPGAIIASVTIGSGEVLFASRTGAIFGYALLWFVLVCIAGKLIQVYSGARYMVLTGEHPMEAWARLPGPRGWFPATLGGLTMLCFPFWAGGLALMLGTALNWIFGLDTGGEASQRLRAQLFASATLLAVMMLTLVQSYAFLEKVQTAILGVLLLCVLIAVALAPVNWLQALRSTFAATLPAYEDWMKTDYPGIVSTQTVLVSMTILMAALGGATYDYIGYLSLFREKGWGALGPRAANSEVPPVDSVNMLAPPVIAPGGANLQTGRRWLRPLIVDVLASFACVLVYSVCFNVLGAAILHPHRAVPDGFGLLTRQVEFLTPLHPSMKYVYQVGVFMAFWGTIYGAFEIYSRTAYECFRPLSARVRRTPFIRFRLPVCLYVGVGGLLLVWLVANPMRIIEPAALVGTTTCGLWCFAMIWADRRFLPRPLRMSRLWIALNVLAGLAMTGFGGGAIVDYLRHLAG